MNPKPNPFTSFGDQAQLIKDFILSEKSGTPKPAFAFTCKEPIEGEPLGAYFLTGGHLEYWNAGNIRNLLKVDEDSGLYVAICVTKVAFIWVYTKPTPLRFAIATRNTFRRKSLDGKVRLIVKRLDVFLDSGAEENMMTGGRPRDVLVPINADSQILLTSVEIYNGMYLAMAGNPNAPSYYLINVA